MYARCNDNMFRVIEAYKPYRKGDLLLDEGDSVDNVKDLGHGWLYGRNVTTGKKGAFPEGCVDRDATISGAFIRRFSRNPKSVKPNMAPKVTVIDSPLPKLPTIMDDVHNDDIVTREDQGAQSDGNTGDKNCTDCSRFTETSEPRKLHFYIYILLMIVSATIISGIVYLLLVYSFAYDFVTAGYVVTGVFVFLFFGLVFSPFIRCVVFIMLPNLFSNKGKAMILSIITGLLLSGPAMNISYNTEEVSQSLGCTADLIYNQTSALRKQLEEPIRNLGQKLMDYIRNLQLIVESIRSAMKPLTDTISTFSNAVRGSVDQLQRLAKQCETGLTRAGNECKSGNNRAKQRCKDSIDRVDPTNTIKDTVDDILGILGRRKKRTTNITLEEGQHGRSLVKRGVLSSICNIFDTGSGVCGALSSVSVICNPIDLLSNAMRNAAETTLESLAEVTEFFDFRVVNDVDVSGLAKTSKNASTIVNEIKEDILSKTQVIRYIFSVINKILSMSLLFLFFTSLNYVMKYRKKLNYDNKYITRDFIQLDEDCKRQGKESVLPLRKKEYKNYRFTTSMRLSTAELSGLKESAMFFVYHFMITTITISFDYILYYVLQLIQQYADVALTVQGINTIDVQVDGKGIFSRILHVMVSTIDLNSTYSVDFNFTTCLPNPSRPNVYNSALIVSLYVVVLCMLIMQAYGSRLRRKIASSFYPKQERSRILYLHEKIICDRVVFAALLKDLVFRRRKENEVRKYITTSGFVSGKLACLYRCCNFFLPEKRSCHSCDLTARRGRLFVKCQNNTCNAMFCKECFSVMEGRCFVCGMKQGMQDG